MTRDDLSRAADPRTPIEELTRLASGAPEVAAVVAANPSLHETIAAMLAERRDTEVDFALASNPSVPFDLLALIARRSIDPSFLTHLARCLVQRRSDRGLSDPIVENPHTPPEALRLLVKHPGHHWTELHLHRNWEPRSSEPWQSLLLTRALLFSYRADEPPHECDHLARAGAIDSDLRAALFRDAPARARALALARGMVPPRAAPLLARNEIVAATSRFALAIMTRGHDWPSLYAALGLSERLPSKSGVVPGAGGLSVESDSSAVHQCMVQHRDYCVDKNRSEPSFPVPDLLTLRAVAAHPRVHPRTLIAMTEAGPFTPLFAEVAACSRAATADALRAIASADVLRREPTAVAIAAHPACPSDVQLALMQCATLAVDLSLAKTPLLDPAILKLLAKRPEESIRAAIAARSDLPQDIASILRRDSSKAVRAALAASAMPVAEVELTRYATDRAAPVRAGVAARPVRLPDPLRHRLVRDRVSEVRASFASRTDLSHDEQQLLSADECVAVREVLASNHSITSCTADALIATASLAIAIALVGNPAVDDSQLRQLLKLLPGLATEELRQKGCSALKALPPLDLSTTLAAIFQRERSAWKLLVLSHPACPRAILEHVHRYEGWMAKALVAAHPSTPSAVRDALRMHYLWPVVEACESVGSEVIVHRQLDLGWKVIFECEPLGSCASTRDADDPL